MMDYLLGDVTSNALIWSVFSQVVKAAGGMMNGGMAGNAVNPGILNGIVLNGQLPQVDTKV